MGTILRLLSSNRAIIELTPRRLSAALVVGMATFS